MKLSYTDGCICTSLLVDGRDWSDLSTDEQKSVCRKLLYNTKDEYVLQQLFINALQVDGEYTDLGQCETCGDWVTNYELEIS